jgi:hypothetical protein
MERQMSEGELVSFPASRLQRSSQAATNTGSHEHSQAHELTNPRRLAAAGHWAPADRRRARARGDRRRPDGGDRLTGDRITGEP